VESRENWTEPYVVVAPDKFKGSLAAADVAEAMCRGVEDAGWDGGLVSLPIADGGDGSVDAAVRAGWSPRVVATRDAFDAPIMAQVAVAGPKAIVEVADICGLPRAKPAPEQALNASSHGVGIVIRQLLDEGIGDITLALGGSGTTDGGAGMLTELGLRLGDAAGHQIGRGGSSLTELAHVDPTPLDARLAGLRLTMACDVDNPMVGSDGSAEVYAAQKGADPDGVGVLSRSLRRLAELTEPALDAQGLHAAPRTGAAGGLAWAGALVGAELRSGAGVFLDLLDVPAAVRDSSLVITGEGSLDNQSLRGKGPVAVARLAAEASVRVVAVVGTNRCTDLLELPFDDVRAIDRLDRACQDFCVSDRSLVVDFSYR